MQYCTSGLERSDITKKRPNKQNPLHQRMPKIKVGNPPTGTFATNWGLLTHSDQPSGLSRNQLQLLNNTPFADKKQRAQRQKAMPFWNFVRPQTLSLPSVRRYAFYLTCLFTVNSSAGHSLLPSKPTRSTPAWCVMSTACTTYSNSTSGSPFTNKAAGFSRPRKMARSVASRLSQLAD